MRKLARGLLWIAIASGAGLAASWAPDAFAELEYFRASEFRLVGNQRLTLDEVLEVADLPALASVWDDPFAWERRIETHPLVREARIEPDYPNELVISVTEREPVALVATPLLQPVDRDGHLLPVDPTLEMLDLPIISPRRGIDPNASLTPVELRTVASEIDRLQHVDPAFLRSVSEVELDTSGDLVARVGTDGLFFRFTALVSSERLQMGMDALADAVRREPNRAPEMVDLRFAGRVVFKYANSSRGQ